MPKTVAVPMGFGFDRDTQCQWVLDPARAGLTVSYVDEASDSVGNHLGVTNGQDKMLGELG